MEHLWMERKVNISKIFLYKIVITKYNVNGTLNGLALKMNGYGTWKSTICTSDSWNDGNISDDFWEYRDTLTGFFRDGIPVGFCIKTDKNNKHKYEMNYVNGLYHGRMKYTFMNDNNYIEWDNGYQKGATVQIFKTIVNLSFIYEKNDIGFMNYESTEVVYINTYTIMDHNIYDHSHTGRIERDRRTRMSTYYGRMTYLNGVIEFKSTNTTYAVDGTSMDGTKKLIFEIL